MKLELNFDTLVAAQWITFRLTSSSVSQVVVYARLVVCRSTVHLRMFHLEKWSTTQFFYWVHLNTLERK